MEHNQLTTVGACRLGQIFEELVQQDSVAPMVVYFVMTTVGACRLGQIFEEVVQQDSVAPMVVYFVMTSLDPVRHLQHCPFLVLHQTNMAALVEVLVAQKAERDCQNE